VRLLVSWNRAFRGCYQYSQCLPEHWFCSVSVCAHVSSTTEYGPHPHSVSHSMMPNLENVPCDIISSLVVPSSDTCFCASLSCRPEGLAMYDDSNVHIYLFPHPSFSGVLSMRVGLLEYELQYSVPGGHYTMCTRLHDHKASPKHSSSTLRCIRRFARASIRAG
jgi:hypothetical protein